MGDQAVFNGVNDESKLQENFQNLVDSIAKNDTKKFKIYHKVFKQEVAREQEASDLMKEQIRIAQSRRNFHKDDNNGGNIREAKRETNDDSAELFAAIKNNDQETVKKLVEKKDAVFLTRIVNDDNETGAHVAVHTGNLVVLQYLVTKDKALVKSVDKWGRNVLHIAAKIGHLHMIKYLIDVVGMNLYMPENNLHGDSIIHIAAENGHVHIVKWFCEEFKHVRGNPNHRNTKGETLMMSAVKGEHMKVVEFLTEDGMANPLALDYEGQNVLFFAAVVDSVDIPHYLMHDMGIVFDVNLRNMYGMTIVFVAARYNSLDFIKYIIEQRNASIDATNHMGWTPLHEAACEGHLNVVRYLVEMKADLHIREAQGRTPLEVAKKKLIIEFLKAEMQKRPANNDDTAV